MPHFQSSVSEQSEFFQRLPATFNCKTVDRADIGVGQTQPFTLRHWADAMQQFDGGWETKKNRARTYFNSFINDTFRAQFAPHVNVVEAFNEVWANSQNSQERQARIEQDRAFAVVWNQEYRTSPELAHIRLALMSAAVGNDLPRESAVTALENDCLVNYHPYVAVYKNTNKRLENRQAEIAWAMSTGFNRAGFHSSLHPFLVDMGDALTFEGVPEPGQRSPGDWRWCSGRWHFMEQEWGLKPEWIFTETGPCRDYTGGLILDPQGGWKLIWGNDGREQMIDTMRQWLDDVVQTPAFNEGRIAGFHQFTIGGGNTWKWFNLAQPELNMLGDLIAEKWAVNLPPPPEGWQRAAWDKSVELQTISLNPNAALQRAIFADGFVPVESEFSLDGRALQAAEHLQTGERRVYYAVIPNWSDVRWFGEPNEAGHVLAVDVSEHQGEIDVPTLQAKMRAAQ